MKFPVSILLALCFVASASAADLQTPLEAYRSRQDDATPVSVLEWLKAGNQRFAAGRSEHGGYPVDAKERLVVSAQGQRPLAVVLSCIDSRTAPEVVFDVSIGDLFTTRVGANVVNDDILGSIEIAVASGAKLVVVLGHTDCGGVKGACNNLELGHMTQLLERVKPAIAQTNARLDADPSLSAEIGERVTTNRRYVAEVSHANAHASTEQIRQRSSILREQADSGAIQIVTAIFNVDTGLVTFDP